MGFLSEELHSELDVPHLAPHHPAFPLEANAAPLQNQWKHQNLTCTKLEGAQPIAQSLSNTSQNPKDPNQVLWSERNFGLLESASRKDICRAETTRDAARFPDWPDRLSPRWRAHFHPLLPTRDFISGLTLCCLTRGQNPNTYASRGNFAGEKVFNMHFVQVF